VAGHVNNMVYLRWLEDLRNELFSKIYPLEKLIELDNYPVVVSNEMKYKSQIRLFDNPIGKIFIESYQHGIITLKVEIKNQGKTTFKATQKCALMNLIHHEMFTGNLNKLVNYAKM
jgi:acyl-CoA thioester hydrolase